MFILSHVFIVLISCCLIWKHFNSEHKVVIYCIHPCSFSPKKAKLSVIYCSVTTLVQAEETFV